VGNGECELKKKLVGEKIWGGVRGTSLFLGGGENREENKNRRSGGKRGKGRPQSVQKHFKVQGRD